MTLAEKLTQLTDDLAIIDDPQERLGAVVDRAKKLPPLADAERTDANRVRGCISLVHLVGEFRDGHCYFRCEADGPLVRGLVALLCNFYGGATAADIATFEPDPLEALDLAKNLSPTRRNGLTSARATIRAFAEKHSSP
ncbi:MAG: Fe-S metabolism protein SufE [Opitutia bacterium]|nr:SufE family protein [Opitutaceae bacterium]PHX71250.1 MAG: Fe-S metabolism protein SufE [Opitutae bacterium]